MWRRRLAAFGRRPTRELPGSESSSVKAQLPLAISRLLPVTQLSCGLEPANQILAIVFPLGMESTSLPTAARVGSTWDLEIVNAFPQSSCILKTPMWFTLELWDMPLDLTKSGAFS